MRLCILVLLSLNFLVPFSQAAVPCACNGFPGNFPGFGLVQYDDPRGKVVKYFLSHEFRDGAPTNRGLKAAKDECVAYKDKQVELGVCAKDEGNKKGRVMNKIGLYLSEEQIELVKRQRFTSCEPKARLEKIAPGKVNDALGSIGQVFGVADQDGNVRGKVRLVDAFLTTFGHMDPRLLEGKGCASDLKKCQNEYRAFWKENFPGETLEDATELFVAIYEPTR